MPGTQGVSSTLWLLFLMNPVPRELMACINKKGVRYQSPERGDDRVLGTFGREERLLPNTGIREDFRGLAWELGLGEWVGFVPAGAQGKGIPSIPVFVEAQQRKRAENVQQTINVIGVWASDSALNFGQMKKYSRSYSRSFGYRRAFRNALVREY